MLLNKMVERNNNPVLNNPQTEQGEQKLMIM